MFHLSSEYLVIAVDRSHHEPHASPPNKESDDEPQDLTQYTHKQSTRPVEVDPNVESVVPEPNALLSNALVPKLSMVDPVPNPIPLAPTKLGEDP